MSIHILTHFFSFFSVSSHISVLIVIFFWLSRKTFASTHDDDNDDGEKFIFTHTHDWFHDSLVYANWIKSW